MPKSKAVPKVTSKVRHRRKKSEMPFADALSAATKRLVKAQREREQAQKSLTSLNAEIPNLQRTIQALQVQLKGVMPIAGSQSRGNENRTENNIASTGEHRAVTSAVIPEGIVLPAEDLTGMGSTRAVDEDVLPDAEGEAILPED